MTPGPAQPATTTRPATTSCRWDGTATALSSVVHGEEVLGTMTTFRRERMVCGDRITEIPVVSGNALRGRLRRIGASMLWEALGCPPLPLPVAAALWSGGALGKRRPAGQPALLSGAELARVRALVPHLAVFGGAGGGRILKGTLAVGKLVPRPTPASTTPSRPSPPSASATSPSAPPPRAPTPTRRSWVGWGRAGCSCATRSRR
jgi:hypothetical protein